MIRKVNCTNIDQYFVFVFSISYLPVIKSNAVSVLNWYIYINIFIFFQMQTTAKCCKQVTFDLFICICCMFFFLLLFMVMGI